LALAEFWPDVEPITVTRHRYFLGASVPRRNYSPNRSLKAAIRFENARRRAFSG
jgi:hypothetical protein